MDYLGYFRHPPILASVAAIQLLSDSRDTADFTRLFYSCLLLVDYTYDESDRQRFDDFLCEKKFNLQG